MQALENNIIKLRALEPEDLGFLFSVENNNEFWEVSGTQTPFSRHILEQYLANAHQDIFEAKQLRLVIMDINSQENVGLIDLFNYSPQHNRAGVGILILKKFHQKGFATAALKLFIDYAFSILHLHQIYANINVENQNSILLFEKLFFKRIGTKKDWVKINETYKDIYLYQLINN